MSCYKLSHDATSLKVLLESSRKNCRGGWICGKVAALQSTALLITDPFHKWFLEILVFLYSNNVTGPEKRLLHLYDFIIYWAPISHYLPKFSPNYHERRPSSGALQKRTLSYKLFHSAAFLCPWSSFKEYLWGGSFVTELQAYNLFVLSFNLTESLVDTLNN